MGKPCIYNFVLLRFRGKPCIYNFVLLRFRGKPCIYNFVLLRCRGKPCIYNEITKPLNFHLSKLQKHSRGRACPCLEESHWARVVKFQVFPLFRAIQRIKIFKNLTKKRSHTSLLETYTIEIQSICHHILLSSGSIVYVLNPMIMEGSLHTSLQSIAIERNVGLVTFRKNR